MIRPCKLSVAFWSTRKMNLVNKLQFILVLVHLDTATRCFIEEFLLQLKHFILQQQTK